jgi:hypothetical protein
MKTITLKNCQPVLGNPEDKFNDLIEMGLSVREALLDLMEESIVENKIEEQYPDYYGDTYEGDGKGNWKISLRKFED